MARIHLLNKYTKRNLPVHQLACTMQCNCPVKLFKIKKRSSKIISTQRILRIASVVGKPLNLLGKKNLIDENIILVEDDKLITEKKDLVKGFKDHFDNIVDNLYIKRGFNINM